MSNNHTIDFLLGRIEELMAANAELGMARVRLEVENEKLKADLKEATISPWFDCLTRNGVDLALKDLDTTGLAAVYFDLDHFKMANDKYGKVGSSELVKNCLQFRSTDVICAGQWFSGDEFVAFVKTGDAVAFAWRQMEALEGQGLSATIGYGDLDGHDLKTRVVELDKFIDGAKKLGWRGCVMDIDALEGWFPYEDL